MILIDTNQILVGSLMVESRGNPDLNEDLIRHIFLNTIRSIKTRNSKKFGEPVLCYDSTNCWRKDIFKEYKQNRKKQRKASSVDWNKFHDIMTTIRNEMFEVLPYKIVCVERCEADDIIGTLCKRVEPEHRPILIVSSDKDFQQLQVYPGVQQYSPIHGKMLKCGNPTEFLTDHILRGDTSDGIPNIISEDDSIINEDKRQQRLTKKRFNEIMHIINTGEQDTIPNWNRNSTMIDLCKVPVEYQNTILNNFERTPCGDRSKLLDYMIKHRMRLLIEQIQEF